MENAENINFEEKVKSLICDTVSTDEKIRRMLE